MSRMQCKFCKTAVRRRPLTCDACRIVVRQISDAHSRDDIRDADPAKREIRIQAHRERVWSEMAREVA